MPREALHASYRPSCVLSSLHASYRPFMRPIVLQSGRLPAGVSDLSYLERVRIDAIVGLDVLARTSFSINYRTRVLRFAPTDREDSVAPLELVWPFLTVRMTIAGRQVRLLVDTGSSDIVLIQTRMPAALADAPPEQGAQLVRPVR